MLRPGRRRPSVLTHRRSARSAFGAALLLLVASSGATAQPAPAPARIAVEETVPGHPVLAAALDALPSRRAPVPVAVRVTVALPASPPADGGTTAALAQRLRRHEAGGVPVWLAIETAIPAVDGIPAWVQELRRLAAAAGGHPEWLEIHLDVSRHESRVVAFALKQAAVELRAAVPSAKVLAGGAQMADAAWLESLLRGGVGPYIDGIAVPAAYEAGALEAVREVLEQGRPGAIVAVTGIPLESPDALIRGELSRIGGAVSLSAYRGAAPIMADGLRKALSLADLLGGEIVRLEPGAASLTVAPAGARATLVYDTARFGTTLVYSGPDAPVSGTADIAITIRAASTPTLRDPFTGARSPVLAFTRDEATQLTRLRVPLRADPLIVDFNDGLADAVTERSEVSGRTTLSVNEIVARHQQRRARQDRLLDSHVARARMEQHFRPTTTDPGFDVVTENRFFSDREGVEWEELSFSVNGTKWGPDRPAFPLLQPEKVLSPPLDLRLDADYRYRLDGTAAVDGADCYVVRFEPVRSGRSLYRGTVWIDRRSFRRVKLQAVQTELSAPVVSNDETVRFARVGEIDGEEIHLPVETTAQQIVLIAGRNILVEKIARFADYELNPADFASRRLEARRGDRIMYRETDLGTRYYVKEGETRIVSERATMRAKAMAIGTTIDPSFDFPLPIFGINYLDFDFGGPDSQLALLFGGVLALGNIQRPKLVGPIDGSVDFFGIAVPGSDRVYGPGGERDSDRLLTWPLSAGGNLGWQYTSFQKLSTQYLVRFDGFIRDRTTNEDYVVPRSTTTHGVGMGWEYRRAGYSLVLNGMWHARARWEPWGPAGALVESPRTYTKYAVSLTKEFYLNLFSKIRVNGAYFGGRRLDRFSQYQFGLFDETRIHGVPASGVRFGELAMLRGSYSLNVFEQYRFDLFIDRAWGRDRDASRLLEGAPEAPRPAAGWDGITGLGVAVNLRAPWSTILRAEVGRSFLPERHRATGSTVVQVLFLKPL